MTCLRGYFAVQGEELWRIHVSSCHYIVARRLGRRRYIVEVKHKLDELFDLARLLNIEFGGPLNDTQNHTVKYELFKTMREVDELRAKTLLTMSALEGIE